MEETEVKARTMEANGKNRSVDRRRVANNPTMGGNFFTIGLFALSGVLDWVFGDRRENAQVLLLAPAVLKSGVF
jgi:hypothetical protein